MRTVAVEAILFVRAKRANASESGEHAKRAVLAATTSALFPGLLNVLACLAPFFAFQWFTYKAFCRRGADAQPEWCSREPPISFTYALAEQESRRDGQHQLVQFVLAAPCIGKAIQAAVLQ